MVVNHSNPYIQQLFIKESTKIQKISDSNLKIVDSKGKQVEGNVVFAKEHNVDRTPFIKVFETNFLSNLGTTGIVIFNYICKHCIKYNHDYIVIYNEDVKSRTRYNNDKSIYKGINELITANVIAKSSKAGIYWLNVNILYKGERWYLQNK